MQHSFLLTAVILSLASPPLLGANARASTNQTQALTLDQALELAELQHPELAQARAWIDAAEGRVLQAGSFPNPAAIARVESAPFENGASGGAEFVAGLSQPLPLGGRLAKAREAEELERDRRTRELEVRRRQLQRRVRGAFATSLYQEKAAQALSGNVMIVERIAAIAKARVDSGDTSIKELAMAEMELAKTRMELARAGAMRERAMVELKAAIGNPELTVSSLAGSIDTAFEIPTLETLAANLAASPEAALGGAEVRALHARAALAKAERIPDIRVEALYRRLDASNENAFDLGLSIPIPWFDRNRGRLREARAEAAAAEARSRLTQNQLRVRLLDAHAQLAAALATSKAFKEHILPLAGTLLGQAEARYTEGDASLAEILPLRRQSAAAQMAWLESLRDVMAAWTELSDFLPQP